MKNFLCVAAAAAACLSAGTMAQAGNVDDLGTALQTGTNLTMFYDLITVILPRMLTLHLKEKLRGTCNADRIQISNTQISF